MRLIKKLAATLSALLCVSVMSVTVSAVNDPFAETVPTQITSAELFSSLTKEQKNELSYFSKAAGISYNSVLIKQIEKYNSSKSTKKKTFEKSYTKKLIKKIKDCGNTYDFVLRNEDTVIEYSSFGGKRLKAIAYAGGKGVMLVANGKTVKLYVTGSDSAYKVKCTFDQLNEYFGFDVNKSMREYFENNGFSFEELDNTFTNSSKFSYFTFKYKEKEYTYERFGDDTGILFDSNGNAVMICNDGEIQSFKFKSTVKSSSFALPDDITVTDYSNIDISDIM